MPRPARLPAECLRPFVLDLPHPRTPPQVFESQAAALPPGPLEWTHLFGNDGPVEIEVGFGKGLFLLNESCRRPHTNFLGIEIERKYVMLTASRLARRCTANVRLACTDAHWLLRERVAAASVAAVHIYFPDPWWKKRHRKRRLLTPDFAARCARVLRAGGRLHFVSDVAEYFAESIDLLNATNVLRSLEWPAPEAVHDERAFLTNFERKYRKEGRPLYRALFERIP